MERLIVTGATGFIGRALCRTLCGEYEVVALTRDKNKAERLLGTSVRACEWRPPQREWQKYVDGAYAVINFAGENIGSGLWTKSKCREIVNSRIAAAEMLFEAVQSAARKPAVLIQASAVGYYGPQCEQGVDESAPAGEGFLADVCKQWEHAEEPFEALGIRKVIARSGAVLGPDGGLLKRLAEPFRIGIGFFPGDGRQWLSWIAIEDEIAAIRFLIENKHLSGAFNLTSPVPIRLREFCAQLAGVMNTRLQTGVPAVALRLVFGKMGDELLLASQKVLPSRLEQAGYHFRHREAAQLLKGIYGEKSNRSCRVLP